MPIYAYRCAACGHSKDVLQKLSDAPLSVCPACGAEQFAKQITAAGFQLKGSGWYATDFRNGSSSAPAAAKPAAAEGGSGTASSGDSTPSGSTASGTTPSSSAGGGCGGSCACH